MTKSLQRLLSQNLKRLKRKQQTQQKKFVQGLLSAYLPPLKKVKKKATQKLAAPVSPKKIIARKRPVPIQSVILPGKWMASYVDPSLASVLPRRRLAYWLYLPDRISTTGLPLVVMLHGCGQNAQQFATGTRMNQLAEEHGFAVLYPQQSLRAHPQRCWPWYEKLTQTGGGETPLIVAAIDKVMQRYELDPQRVYVSGISAGAAMAHILGLCHPEKIAAVALHSGPVFGTGHNRIGAYAVMQHGSTQAAHTIESLIAKQNTPYVMPAMLLQGQADKIVRPINQIQLGDQFKIQNQLDISHAKPIIQKPEKIGEVHSSHSYRLQDYLRGGKLLLSICEIENLEHAWSGGDCTLPYNSCNGPDASTMIWKFFSSHRRVVIQ